MTSITYIGMDVHTTNFTLCCYSFEDDKVYATVQVKPEYTQILKYINRIRKQRGEDTRFVCGYEAGCLGYSLYHQLTDHGVECVILAPSTMAETPGKKIKTDKRDAEKIARCLAYHQYKPVYIPDEEDDAVKEYIRMRDDVKAHLKETKQQIIAYYTRHGFQFDGSIHWTQKHLNWVERLQFKNSIHQEVLREYLTVFYDLSEKVAVYDARIEELSHSARYAENVGKLCCFSGIATHTALSLLAEVGDFSRFRSAPQFASYLGLVPGEHSSSDKQHRTGITKAGNSHLRRLLIESAHCYSRGAVGKKSKAQKERQAGNSPEVIAYADRAVDRLKRKYQRIALRSRSNIAKTAVARELACFIWGMMTGNISATALH